MKKISFILFAVFVTAFILWSMLYQAGTIGGGTKVPAGEKPASAEADKTVHKLETAEIPVFFQAVGTVRSREEIAVISRLITARVTEVPFRGGEHFKEGDVLVKMEDRDLKAQVDAAAENLKGAESRLKFAETEYERNAKLVQTQVVATRIFEESASNLSAARAQAAMMKHELQNAQTNFEYAAIHAPFDGVVSERLTDPGDLATPLNPLLRIFNPAKLQFRVPVREGLISKVKIGDILHARVESTNRIYDAAVKEIIPSVDPGSRSFLVNACLDGDTRGLMPGMFAVCSIPTGKRTVLPVPLNAVKRIGQLEYLMMKTPDGGFQRRLVKTVPLDDTRAEIISGAAAGDEYTLEEQNEK